MTTPLVVIDADVLGRRRTGDETYVAGLLRELAGAGDDGRRHGEAGRPAHQCLEARREGR